MNYPGGKNGNGVYQQLISLMPPHECYIEPFLGSGAVLRRKKRAKLNIGLDLDSEVLEAVKNQCSEDFIFKNLNAIDFLKTFEFNNPKTLVYLDPPYLREVRSSKNKLYKYEFWTLEAHTELLNLVKNFKALVMISGYDSTLYNYLLPDWRKETFTTVNRAGKRTTETVWLNFPQPLELHDYRFLGSNFREREKINRQKKRWLNKLQQMDALRRYALLDALNDFKTEVSLKQAITAVGPIAKPNDS